MKSRFLALSLAVGLSLVAGSASAATATGSFDVSATVPGSCVIASASAIAFGEYDPTSTHATDNLNASGSILVRCTAGSSNVRVSLDEGLNATSDSSPNSPIREMLHSSGATLHYSITKSASGSDEWGQGGGSDNIIPSFTSSLVPVELITYASIRWGQNAVIGTYTDTVGVTVTF